GGRRGGRAQAGGGAGPHPHGDGGGGHPRHRGGRADGVRGRRPAPARAGRRRHGRRGGAGSGGAAGDPGPQRGRRVAGGRGGGGAAADVAGRRRRGRAREERVMPVLDEWDDAAGDWKPDEIDQKVRAVIEYRNRVADSVPGPVPEMGTPEWAAADWRTQLAAHARHERDVAAAQGKAISNRLAAEAAERRAVVEASNAVSAAYRQDGHANRFPLNEAMRRSREVVVPFQ